MMTLYRLKWPNVTKSATQLVAAAMTPRPCGPRNRAVMTVPTIAPSIQYAFVPLVSVTAFHSRIQAFILVVGHEQRVRPPRTVVLIVEVVDGAHPTRGARQEGVDL